MSLRCPTRRSFRDWPALTLFGYLALGWLLLNHGNALASDAHRANHHDQHPLIAQALEAKRYGLAVAVCDDLSLGNKSVLADATISLCAKAHQGLAEAFAKRQLMSEAQRHWQRAAVLERSLTAAPVGTQEVQPHATASAMATNPGPSDPSPPERGPTDRMSSPYDPSPRRAPKTPPAQLEIATEKQVVVFSDLAPGPRHDRTFGIGLSGGFDGILAITVAVLAHEYLAIEASVGILYPTIDARLRWHGLRSTLSPVLGLGVTTPLGGRERFALEIGGYRDLYQLGQTVHLDIGLSLAIGDYVDIFAGVALLTTLDQDHPDRLLFFPQAAVQTLCYF